MSTTAPDRDGNRYYPPPESQGGWRRLDSPDDIRATAGMDADKLDRLFELQTLLHGSHAWGI